MRNSPSLLVLLLVLPMTVLSVAQPASAQSHPAPAAKAASGSHPLVGSPLHIDHLEARWRLLRDGDAPAAEIERFRRLLLQAERLFRRHAVPESEAGRLASLREIVQRALASELGASRVGSALAQPPVKSAPAVPLSKATPVALQGADTCEDAPLVQAGSYLGTTAGSSRDGRASCAPLGAAGDVWYRVEVAAGETLFASTEGSSFDTVLSLHSICPPPPDFNNDAELACDDDGGAGQTSSLAWQALVGSEVLVRVSAALVDAGDYQLTLAAGGRIEGRVLGEAGGPLQGVEIEVVADATGVSTFTSTDADGRFAVGELPAGSYRLVARSFGAHRGEVYDDVPCLPDDLCEPGAGDPIAVSLDETVDLGDIRLRLGAAVEGQVLERSTGAPVADVAVSVQHIESFSLRSTFTGPDGSYRFEGLPAGEHRALVNTFGAYVDQAWDGIDCPIICDFDDLTPFTLQLGATSSGIDFSLSRLGRVGGLVRGPSGSPLLGQPVSLFDLDAQITQTTFTEGDGRFEFFAVGPGRYYAVAAAELFSDYVPELYDEVPCTATPSGECDFDLGTPIDIMDGAGREDIDFTLSLGGSISGRVTDAASGQPVQGVQVLAHPTSGGGVPKEASTMADGSYVVSGLPGGGYWVQAQTLGEPYLDILYPDLVCAGTCPFGEATPVTVVFEQQVPDIDLVLPRSSIIRGRVTSAMSGQPLEGIQVLASSDNQALFTSTGSDGRYELTGLEPADFTLDAGSSEYLFVSLDLTVGVGEVFEDVDFALDEGGRITGRVRDRDGDGVDVSIEVYDEDFELVASQSPGFGLGGFYEVTGLRAGAYYVRAGDLFDGFALQAWPGANCSTPEPETCSGAQTVAVEVAQTTAGIDFQLDRFGDFVGSLSSGVTHTPLEGVVELYDASGELQGSAGTLDGIFVLDGIVPGDYYFIARPDDSALGYMDQVFGGGSCVAEACDPLDGTSLRGDYDTTGSASFELDRGGSLSGRLADRSGRPLDAAAFAIELYDADGHFIEMAGTSADRYFFRALPDAAYRLLARDLTGMRYFDRVWPGGSCVESGCEPGSGQAITVAGAQNVGDIDFVIDPVEPTTGRALAAEGAFPIAGATVQQWSVDGLLIRQTRTGVDGRFSLQFRSPSYLSISSDRFQDTVWPDVPCPNGDCRAVLGDGELITPQPDIVIDDVDFILESTSDCGSATELCTLDNRFRTTVRWQTDDAQGEGGAVPLTEEAGYFWFFDPANVEVVLKTLDACDGFGHFWVFLAGLTNVGVEVTVLDTFTGSMNVYRHEPGPLFQPIFDTVAFETCSATSPASDEIERVPSAKRSIGPLEIAGAETPAGAGLEKRGPGKNRPEKTCVSSDEAACLTGERFRVEATFDTDGQGSGQAKAVPLTSDTAYFWFFDPENIEVVLKVLDACDGFDRHWVFAAGLTNVEVHITVTDTETGAVWTYDNVLGEDFQPVADTSTLLCP